MTSVYDFLNPDSMAVAGLNTGTKKPSIKRGSKTSAKHCKVSYYADSHRRTSANSLQDLYNFPTGALAASVTSPTELSVLATLAGYYNTPQIPNSPTLVYTSTDETTTSSGWSAEQVPVGYYAAEALPSKRSSAYAELSTVRAPGHEYPAASTSDTDEEAALYCSPEEIMSYYTSPLSMALPSEQEYAAITGAQCHTRALHVAD